MYGCVVYVSLVFMCARAPSHTQMFRHMYRHIRMRGCCCEFVRVYLNGCSFVSVGTMIPIYFFLETGIYAKIHVCLWIHLAGAIARCCCRVTQQNLYVVRVKSGVFWVRLWGRSPARNSACPLIRQNKISGRNMAAVTMAQGSMARVHPMDCRVQPIECVPQAIIIDPARPNL